MLKYRGPKSLCEMFLDFITTDLIRTIWVNGKDSHEWQFNPGKRLCGGRFDKKFVLYLRCYIYIPGNERRVDERFVELRQLF